MVLPFTLTVIARTALWVLTTALLTACEEGEDPSSRPLEPDATITTETNPDNPFSTFVDVTVDQDVNVQVEHGLDGAFDRTTPEQAATAGEPLRLLVLGLEADRQHDLRLHARDGSRHWRSESLVVETDPLPDDFPACEVEFFIDESEFTAEEVICINAFFDDDESRPVYFCIDRWGTPVSWLRHPDDEGLQAVRALTDGGWASVGVIDSRIAVFDQAGALTVDHKHLWFAGKTRFQHDWIDTHETIEIAEGPWAGAVAFLTATVEPWDGPGEDWIVGEGIIVFDFHTNEVLWDWSVHGEQGDGHSISTLLSYDRQGFVCVWPGWLHANALLHGLDEHGRDYFWISLRAQDWIIKIDAATDEVLWRFGYQGDFEFVDDLDAANPVPLDPVRFMYQQHAPEWQRRDGSRTRFLVFDNGVIRPDANGQPTALDRHSRVVEFELDEETMRATVNFEYGSPDPGSPEHFWSRMNGDADMLPGGDAVQFTVGGSVPPWIAEVSYPGGEPRWRLTCGNTVPRYRVNYFPSLYDTTWWYEVDR